MRIFPAVLIALGLFTFALAFPKPRGEEAMPVRLPLSVTLVDEGGLPLDRIELHAFSADGEFRAVASGSTQSDGLGVLPATNETVYLYAFDSTRSWAGPTLDLGQLEPNHRAALLAGPQHPAEAERWLAIAVVLPDRPSVGRVVLSPRIPTSIQVVAPGGQYRNRLLEVKDRDFGIVYGAGTANNKGELLLNLPANRPLVLRAFLFPERSYDRGLDELLHPVSIDIAHFERTADRDRQYEFEALDWPLDEQLAKHLEVSPRSRVTSADLDLIELATQLSASASGEGRDSSPVDSLRRAVLDLLGAPTPALDRPLYSAVQEAGIHAALTDVLGIIRRSSVLDWTSAGAREAYSSTVWTARKLVMSPDTAPSARHHVARALCSATREWSLANSRMASTGLLEECASLLDW